MFSSSRRTIKCSCSRLKFITAFFCLQAFCCVAAASRRPIRFSPTSTRVRTFRPPSKKPSEMVSGARELAMSKRPAFVCRSAQIHGVSRRASVRICAFSLAILRFRAPQFAILRLFALHQKGLQLQRRPVCNAKAATTARVCRIFQTATIRFAHIRARQTASQRTEPTSSRPIKWV